MPGIQTILHPTDFSENSRPAFQTACALARDVPCDFAGSPCHDALGVPTDAGAAARSAASPPNPRNPSRNCPGPNHRTRRFAWSIGWPKETPRKRFFA